jgi:hypothetical protein
MSHPVKCRTCKRYDKEVGDYCAGCTLDYIVDKWGWNQHTWFTATVTGGTRGAKPHRRPDKRALLRQAFRVYALSYGTEQARQAFMAAVKAILLNTPGYRSFGTSCRKDTGYKNPRVKNLNYAVRMITNAVERRIRRNRGQRSKLESDNFEHDCDQ